MLRLTDISNAFNGVDIICPKVFKEVEIKLQSLIRDRRFKLIALAASNKSCVFNFHGVEYYVFYDYSLKKWVAQHSH